LADGAGQFLDLGDETFVAVLVTVVDDRDAVRQL